MLEFFLPWFNMKDNTINMKVKAKISEYLRMAMLTAQRSAPTRSRGALRQTRAEYDNGAFEINGLA